MYSEIKPAMVEEVLAELIPMDHWYKKKQTSMRFDDQMRMINEILKVKESNEKRTDEEASQRDVYNKC